MVSHVGKTPATKYSAKSCLFVRPWLLDSGSLDSGYLMLSALSQKFTPLVEAVSL